MIEHSVAVVCPMPQASFMFVNFAMMGFIFAIPTISTVSGQCHWGSTLVVAFQLCFLKYIQLAKMCENIDRLSNPCALADLKKS